MNLNDILHIGCYRSNDESWKEVNLHEKNRVKEKIEYFVFEKIKFENLLNVFEFN